MLEPTSAPAVCQLCGGPVSKKNTSGFCNHTPECKRKAQAVANARYRAAHPELAAEKWAAYSPGYKQRRAELDAARRQDPEFVKRARAAVQEYKTRPENADRVREYNRLGRLRYMSRTDRSCLRKGCDQHPRAGFLWCDPHHLEESRQSYRRRSMKRKVRLAERQQWICPWCMDYLPPSLARTHVDHIIPRAIMPIEEEWNLQLLHARCNQEKSDRITPQALALAAEHSLSLVA